jgi:uncharacterized protein (TIGR03790 family)
VLVLGLAALCLAPSLESRVLVIENSASPASMEIGEDYRARRHVKNLLKVICPDSGLNPANETLAYPAFRESIEQPLRACLLRHPGIDFIVLTKGIPIRLTGAATGMSNNQPSLDSFIAAFDYPERRDVIPVVLNDSGFTGKAWANRFWNSTSRFTHAGFGGYLVTRLDAYTADAAKLLTTYSLQSERTHPTGEILLDTVLSHGLTDVAKQPLSAIKDGKLDLHMINEMQYPEYDTDMVAAAAILEHRGLTVTLDRTDKFIGRRGDLMGYCSWGSNDPKFDATGYKFLRFAPGGIAETAVSTSGRTFLPTTGGQSLIADLIEGRVTGVKGYVDEPLLQAIASPTILFDRYTRGWTLAESFYAASRFVGWEDIVVGDPLCAPYH